MIKMYSEIKNKKSECEIILYIITQINYNDGQMQDTEYFKIVLYSFSSLIIITIIFIGVLAGVYKSIQIYSPFIFDGTYTKL